MSTAASVPSWVTAVNDAPDTMSKKIADVIRRCADEETGRNSVRPWTTPRTMASTQVIATLRCARRSDDPRCWAFLSPRFARSRPHSGEVQGLRDGPQRRDAAVQVADVRAH